MKQERWRWSSKQYVVTFYYYQVGRAPASVSYTNLRDARRHAKQDFEKYPGIFQVRIDRVNTEKFFVSSRMRKV